MDRDGSGNQNEKLMEEREKEREKARGIEGGKEREVANSQRRPIEGHKELERGTAPPPRHPPTSINSISRV